MGHSRAERKYINRHTLLKGSRAVEKRFLQALTMSKNDEEVTHTPRQILKRGGERQH